MKKKIISTISAAILLSSVAVAIPETPANPLNSSHHEAQAASKGFKYFTTVNGSTAASDFVNKSIGYGAAGALGYAATGGAGAIVAGTVGGHLSTSLSGIKTVYITDKQYINKAGQIEHHATLYKNKSKTKKAGTAKWITSTTYPNGNKEVGHK